MTVTSWDGSKQRKTVYGKSQREAQDNALKIKGKKQAPNPKGSKVEVLWPVFVSQHVESKSENTRKDYIWAYKRIGPRFGNVAVGAITVPDVSKWMRSLAAGGDTGNTIKGTRKCFRVFLAWAREQGLIEHNPASDLKLPVPVVPKKRPLLTPAMARLVRILEPDGKKRLLWHLMSEIGARPSEAIAVRGEDVKVVRGVSILTIRGTKTAAAPREIPITRRLAELMPDEGRITTLTIFGIEQAWQDAMARTKLPYTNLHQLRKLALTEWARQGVPPDILKRWAGHKSITTTQDVYVRVRASMVFDALQIAGMSKRYVRQGEKTGK